MKDLQHDLIDRFFSGDLTEREDLEFNALMQEKAFSKAVDLQARLKQQLATERAGSPLGRLLIAEAKRAKNKPARKIGRRKVVIFSAAAAVLILFCSGLWWSNKYYGDEALIARFHQPIYDDTYAGVPEGKDLLREAKRAFFQRDYARAEQLTSAVDLRDSAYYQPAQSLKAYALFNQKKYESTIRQIDQILADEPINFLFPEGGADKLRWTRLLAYLGSDGEDNPVFKADLRFFLHGLNEGYRSRAMKLQMILDSRWRKLVF